MTPLHATIEEFAAEGYTHIEANCPRCHVIRLKADSRKGRRQMRIIKTVGLARITCAILMLSCSLCLNQLASATSRNITGTFECSCSDGTGTCTLNNGPNGSTC